MEAINAGQIEMTGIEGITEILALEITAERNRHATTFIKAIIDENKSSDIFLEDMEQKIITLIVRTDKESILFCGLVRKISVHRSEECTIAEIQGVSASVYLDRQKKRRSFQDPNHTGQDIIRTVLEDTPNAEVFFQMPDEKMKIPVIQYEETDWEFILRIASLYKVCVYAGFYSGHPVIYCGLPDRGADSDMEIISSSRGRKRYPFRRICTYNLCRIGEKVPVMDNWSIYGLTCRLSGGLLLFDCCLRQDVRQEDRLYNRRLQGISIKGTVIDTKEEAVKLWLEIDEKQDKEQAYWYQWLPETGNVFYCMPEAGAKVYLHIGGRDENYAFAVGCSHEFYNGGQDRQNPQNRSLIFQTQKKLALLPELLAISNQREKRLDLNLDDSSGIQMESFGQFSVFAGEAVGIKGNKLFLQAAKEIGIVRKDSAQPSVINMGNQFDVFGKYAEVTAGGTPMAMLPAFGHSYEDVGAADEIRKAVIASTPVEGKESNTALERLAVGSKVNRVNGNEEEGEREQWEKLRKSGE